MKKCKNTNKLIKLIHKRRSSANDSITSFVGAVTSLILLGVGFSNFLNLFAVSYVSATDALRLTISSNTLELNLMPLSSDGVFASSPELNINVTLSVTGGYTLGIKTANTGTDATKLINNIDPENPQYFNPIPSAITESTFSSSSTYNNQWGYKPSKYNSTNNEDDYYYPMPSSDSSATLDEVSNFSGTNNYTLAIGARANNTTPIGQYSNTFIITAVSTITCNPNATTIGDAICMQDLDDDPDANDATITHADTIINSMVTGTQYQLMDSRDDKVYYVAKMKDGRVWMTQNLDLDLRTDTTAEDFVALTSENTDLNTAYATNSTTTLLPGYNVDSGTGVITFTPSTATSNTASDWKTTTTAGATTNYNTLPQSFDYGNYYRYTNSTGATTTYSGDNATADCETAHTDGTCDHYHAGNYYDWTAAVAMNTTNSTSYGGVDQNYYNTTRFTAANSICPKGWRLPQGRTSNTATDTGYYSEANYTWLAEGIVTGYITGTTTAGVYPTGGYNLASNSPLYLARTGNKTNTSNPTNTNNAYYWTSTVNSATQSYSAYLNNSYPYPIYSNQPRHNGLAVRCVARQSNTGSTIITFNANESTTTTGTYTGNTGDANNQQTISANTLTNLVSNGFSISGYAFNSWNTESDGSGTSYADSAKYYAITGTETTELTLYAQWAMNQTITFDVNAPTGTTPTGSMSNQTINGGSSTNLTPNGYSISGYAFNSWNTAADGSGTSYANGASYTVAATNTEATKTLYAIWDKVYTITFNIGAGASSISFGGTTYTNGEQYTTAIEGKSYVIGGNYPTKYGFSSWSVTAGTLENSNAAATTYTVTADATITLTGQEATTSISSIATSGDIPSNCATTTPVRNLQLVYDPRDNEAYWVGELCDGKVWMLDNLRLDLSNSTTLASLSSSNTNASDQALSCLKTGQYNDTACTSPYTTAAAIQSTSWGTSGTAYTQAKINKNYSDNIAPVTYGQGSGKIGIYYNYCATSAGSYCYAQNTGVDVAGTDYDIGNDICPAGWHIPTGGATGREYNALYTAYNSNATNFKNALSTPLSGNFYNSSQNDLGTYGNFWSSTWSNTNNMYNLAVLSSNVNPSNISGRIRGFSVRCMLGSS